MIQVPDLWTVEQKTEKEEKKEVVNGPNGPSLKALSIQTSWSSKMVPTRWMVQIHQTCGDDGRQ